MKKLFYICLSLCTMGVFVSSCDDDDENGVVVFENTPEIDAQGVFEGTFIRVQKGTTDSAKAVGQMVISATDSAYVADITLTCEDFNLDKTVNTNISHANQGFVLSNYVTTNPTGNPVYGRISDEQKAEIHFTLNQRSGRKTVTYNYVFEGVCVSDQLPETEE